MVTYKLSALVRLNCSKSTRTNLNWLPNPCWGLSPASCTFLVISCSITHILPPWRLWEWADELKCVKGERKHAVLVNAVHFQKHWKHGWESLTPRPTLSQHTRWPPNTPKNMARTTNEWLHVFINGVIRCSAFENRWNNPFLCSVSLSGQASLA